MLGIAPITKKLWLPFVTYPPPNGFVIVIVVSPVRQLAVTDVITTVSCVWLAVTLCTLIELFVTPYVENVMLLGWIPVSKPVPVIVIVLPKLFAPN